MKKLLLIVALTSCLTGAAYALVDEEKAFVDLYVVSGMMTFACPGYTRDNDTPMKIADKMGVDGMKLWDASRAALLAKFDMEYDRADLIPEVTREVTAAIKASSDAFENKSLCKDASSFAKAGWLKGKK